jgi:hypothetical protein
MLAGAAEALRWEPSDPELRIIVETIPADIAARMRDDGQHLAAQDYPGDRSHGYTLLTVEAFACEYLASSGRPGERVAVNRHWQKSDRVSFTLPVGPRLIKYTGADQSPDGKSRYTMPYGPVLMAYTDPRCTDGVSIPHITLETEELLTRLENNSGKTGIPGGAVRLAVPETDNAFVPYWEAPNEGFSCVPVIGK